MKQTRHMGINLEGLLRNYKGKKINIFNDDNGKPVSDGEARKFIAECLGKGWKKIPMCGEESCPDFDHLEHGCPGHPII